MASLRTLHVIPNSNYLVLQVRPVDASSEVLTGFNAQHGLQVFTHSLGGSSSQSHDGHIWKLLLQHSKLLIVWPAMQARYQDPT